MRFGDGMVDVSQLAAGKSLPLLLYFILLFIFWLWMHHVEKWDLHVVIGNLYPIYSLHMYLNYSKYLYDG